jgi:hypothetical protein
MIIQARNFRHTENNWAHDIELKFIYSFYNEEEDRYESDDYEFDGLDDDCVLIKEYL